VTEEHEFRFSNSLAASDAVPTLVQARWFHATLFLNSCAEQELDHLVGPGRIFDKPTLSF
jgi:hypothetical protein